MAKYIFKRILQAIPLLLVISFIVFTLIHLAPFDMVDSITTPNMDQEQIDFMRHQYGLDQPFLVQYFLWLRNLLTGNFGNSLNGQSILAALSERIPNTVSLVLPAYLTSLVLAIVLGLLAASQRGKWLDRLIDGIASVGIAIPAFWFGIVLMTVFSRQLGWFPVMGMHTLGRENDFGDFLSHFILPYLTLISAFMPELLRFVRSSAIVEIDKDYVTVQEAFQAKRPSIFFKHVSRNVLIPIVTQIGLALPMLVTGALITENVFNWPGVGTYLREATSRLDYPVIMAVMLMSATLVILGNLLSDVLYSIVDPRIGKGEN
ncbi:ABC transporter permease [Streptococcus sp. DD13]|uniref:ABC transporter permease n=1 Tax=Streptococcus sp. DD13 TaxID=1777881 RepID=UPI000799DF45|nr:ABC transporter permease [Streptococcus sp. DD13]KXT78160.1 Oligopeptide transport system permease protein OppB [Streptococcus sp. DD13]